jgi:hypothetical protein
LSKSASKNIVKRGDIASIIIEPIPELSELELPTAKAELIDWKEIQE